VTGFEGKNGDPMTEEEVKAIRSLHRLAKRWPQTLTLASMGSSLCVLHTGDPRWGELLGIDRAKAILDDIDGIPNDGGDW
jgi:hypothetical protein